MSYLRENGLTLALIVIILVVLSPSALAQPFIRPLDRAQSALEFRRIDRALNAFEEARSFEPAAQNLHENELMFALQLGLWEEVEAHLEALETLGSTSPVITCATTQLQLARREYTPPIDDEAAPLSACPGAETALHHLALELFQSGRFESAIPLMKNLVAFGMDSSVEQTFLAFYSAATDPSSAVDKLRQAQASQSPDSQLALTLLITIQDFQAGETPAYLNAQIGQIFSREGKWYLAHEAFKSAVIHDPEYAQAWGYLGVAKDSIGVDGESDLEEAVRLAPNDPLLLVMQAMHYNSQGEADLALPILERAAALDPDNPAIASELGQSYILMGDLESARAAIRQATLLAPDEPTFWILLANYSLHYEIDVDILGLPAVRNALILEPDSIDGWRSLGYAHYLLGNMSLAQRALGRAVDISPADPTTQYYLGLLFQAQGLTNEAIAAWTMAMNLSPDHHYSQLAERALYNLGIH